MDSLGQLLKQMRGPSFIQRSQEIADELLRDPAVRELRQEHPELEESLLRLNVTRLYQFASDRRHCDRCPGLERCPNDFQGHYSNITRQKSGFRQDRLFGYLRVIPALPVNMQKIPTTYFRPSARDPYLHTNKAPPESTGGACHRPCTNYWCFAMMFFRFSLEFRPTTLSTG